MDEVAVWRCHRRIHSRARKDSACAPEHGCLVSEIKAAVFPRVHIAHPRSSQGTPPKTPKYPRSWDDRTQYCMPTRASPLVRLLHIRLLGRESVTRGYFGDLIPFVSWSDKNMMIDTR